MTLRLYRLDSFLWQFNAHVTERAEQDGRPAVVLDQTAFYPTAGGQPNDLGTLNGVPVVDVLERDDGEIVHVLGVPLEAPLAGDEVQGQIDAARRVDHMQQHSGQHVLSQAFVRVADLDTVSVHIGVGDCTIDLPSPRVPAESVERAEDEANRIVFEDRPFVVREMTDAQVAQLPLRKPPAVTGQIRIVEVQDYDWSACGGTHVRSSAQIGLIKITRFEKRGEQTRVSFRCGRRALLDYRELNNLALKLSETFSMSRPDILPAVDKLREEARVTRKALGEAQERLLAYEAQDLLRAAAPLNERVPWRVIARAYDGRDANALKVLARHLTAEPGVIALLGAYSAGRAFLCFSRSRDVPSGTAAGTAHDMAALLRGALQALPKNGGGAKGGGSPEFAQGSGTASGVAGAQSAVDWAAAKMSDFSSAVAGAEV
jgi:alanyl-tRNA synthetase